MEPFIGTVILFAGNFAPRGWAFCQGQLLAISQHSALFSILGTMYGGDGRATFGLPDLRGRVPVGTGHGLGLSDQRQGEQSGQEWTTLSLQNLPSHNHNVAVTQVGGIDLPVNTNAGDEEEKNPGAGVLANTGQDSFAASATPGAKYSGATVPLTGLKVESQHQGQNQPFSTVQPSLGMNYIIALEGLFPSRS